MPEKENVRNTLVIGVGGSGTHSVIGYLHLLNILNNEVDLEPIASGGSKKLMIIDADTTSNRPDSLWGRFSSLYKYNKDDYLLEPNPNKIVKGRKSGSFRFGNYLNDSFLEYLFEKNHLDQDILYGFVGKPPIGSIIFYSKLKEIENNPREGVETSFINFLTGAQRVIFLGSFIGGTGAGIIPTLAKYIKKKNNKIEVIYITHSNWFTLVGNSPLAKYNVSQDVLNKNVVGGMSFLTKNREYFDEIFLIDYPSAVIRVNDGGKEQKENRDFFYLLSGILLRYYLKTDHISKNKIYSMKLIMGKDESIYSKFYIKDVYGDHDLLTDKGGASLYQIIEKTFKFYFYLRYFIEWVNHSAFISSANPIPDETEKYIKQNRKKVIDYISQKIEVLENSLKYLEDLEKNAPSGIKEHLILPFKISIDNYNKKTNTEMVSFLKEIFNLKGVAKKIKIDKPASGIEVGELLAKKIWEIIWEV